MKLLHYNLIFKPEAEGGFTVIVPSLPGCITYGKDLKEAKEAITDAIRGYIASVKKHKGQVLHDAEAIVHNGGADLERGRAERDELGGVLPGGDAADARDRNPDLRIARDCGQQVQRDRLHRGAAVSAVTSLAAHGRARREGIEVDADD